MKLTSLISLALLCFTASHSTIASDIDTFKGEKGELKISGGTAHIPVMKIVAKKIMQLNPNINITIAGGGSGAGIKQVGEGLVGIGNSGRKAKPKEISTYGLSMYKWAIDGVAPVVNPSNRINALSSQQLKDIYSGKITSWKSLGGEDHNITVFTRDASSGTRSVFWKKALQKGDISASAHFVSSNGAMKSAIANDPYAIGYVSVGYFDASVAPVTLDNVLPSLETIKSGQYQVARGLYSNTKGEAKGLSKKFIDYLLSPEGQKIASQKGFIPVN